MIDPEVDECEDGSKSCRSYVGEPFVLREGEEKCRSSEDDRKASGSKLAMERCVRPWLLSLIASAVSVHDDSASAM